MPPVEGRGNGNIEFLGDLVNRKAVEHQFNIPFPHMKRLLRLVNDGICAKAESRSTILTLEPLNAAILAVLYESFGMAIRAIRLVRGILEQGLAEIVVFVGK